MYVFTQLSRPGFRGQLRGEALRALLYNFVSRGLVGLASTFPDLEFLFKRGFLVSRYVLVLPELPFESMYRFNTPSGVRPSRSNFPRIVLYPFVNPGQHVPACAWMVDGAASLF